MGANVGDWGARRRVAGSRVELFWRRPSSWCRDEENDHNLFFILSSSFRVNVAAQKQNNFISARHSWRAEVS